MKKYLHYRYFTFLSKLCLPVLISFFFLSIASAAVEIELKKHTEPESAKPGRSKIKLTGKGILPDTIDPSSVIITLTPVNPQNGMAATVTADRIKITPKDGEHEQREKEGKRKRTKQKQQKIRFFFTLPENLKITRPTHYSVTVEGSTITGEPFSSINSSRIKIKPNKGIVLIDPSDNGVNTELSVTLITYKLKLGAKDGKGSPQSHKGHRVTVSFGAGISVGGAPPGEFGPVTVISKTQAVAQLSIQQGAIPGVRDVILRKEKKHKEKGERGKHKEKDFILKNGFTLVDQIPPEIIITSPAPNVYLNTSSITVTGTTADIFSGIQSVTVGGVEATITDNTFTASNVPLTEGPNTLIAVAIDFGGNSLTATVPVTLDTIAPTITLGQVPDLTNNPSLSITGTVNDANPITGMTVDGSPLPITNNQFSIIKSLTEGENNFNFTATDIAGNVTTATVSVTLDTTPPQVAITLPANLSTLNSSAHTVTGTVDDPQATVIVNGINASRSDGFFSADLTLGEGTRFITAVASDPLGNTATDNISVTVDTTPPRVIINTPEDNVTVFSSPITVTGMINDTVSGTVNGNNATVTVNGIPATILNRGFMAENVLLIEGENTITIVGTDTAGNASTVTLSVSLDTSQPKILIVSGNNQSDLIGATLPQPLIVQLVDASGNPMANRSVAFSVVRNNGVLNGGYRTVTQDTDSDGKAWTDYTLGMHAGAGENRIEVASPGFVGKAVFTATGTAGSADSIHQVNESVFRGAANAPLPQPLQVIATDSGGNPVQGVPVTFTVMAGGGLVGNSSQFAVATNSDGKANAVWILGPDGGINNNYVEVDFIGNTGLPVTFVASGVIAGDPAETTFSGMILTNTGQPIPGVTVTIEDTTLTTTTDDQGQFTLTNVPVGAIHLIADANTAALPNFPYKMMYEVNTIAGVDNTIGMPIYLLPLDLPNAGTVTPTQGAEVEVSNVAGFSLDIPRGTVTFPDGTQSGSVSVTQVHRDKVPMPPPNGMNPKIVFTIQPAGAVFDPPAPIQYPNVNGYGPGHIVNLYSFDHDLGQWVSIGTGSVTEDGAYIASDPGVGIIHGGWHFAEPPPEKTGEADNKGDPLTDKTTRQGLSDAWDESNPGEGIDPDRHEQGGWIVRNSDGTIRVDRWPPGTARGISPTDPPTDGKVVGSFHTHPNSGINPTNGRKWSPRPSGEKEGAKSGDVPWVKADPDIRGNHYVISKDTIYRIDGDGTVSDVGNREAILNTQGF